MLVISSMLTFAQQQKITEKQAIEIAKTLTAKQDVNVYISKQIITSNTKISTLYKSFVAPDYKSYVTIHPNSGKNGFPSKDF